MSIGADLLRFSNRKIVLFDMESSRVNTMMSNLPFQVAWIVADRYKIHSTHSYYLKWPNYDISKGAAAVTRFNPAWVANGDDPEFVLDAFESYVMDPNYIVVGHNILNFDLNLHQLWRETLGRKRDYSYQSRIIDTHLLSRAYKMGWKPDRSNLLAWQYKAMNTPQKGVKTNLTVMCKELGVPIDETRTHEAAYDLELNLGLYRKIVGLVEI